MTDSPFEWKLPIASPPWTALGRKLESACRKALFDFELMPPTEKKIAIALSGGKDSLGLFFLLKAILGRGVPNWDLYAIHVHGAFSCGAGVDQKFLQQICDALQVPLILRHAEQDLRDLQCYSCSRKRRALLFEAAKSVGATTIAFGHHRDDSAQTLLMNLLHKAEFAANLPKVVMQNYGITIIRPLIYIAEEDLRAFAKCYGFARVSCQCPVGQNSLRKQTDQILQTLEHTFPNVRQNLAQAGLMYGSQKAQNP